MKTTWAREHKECIGCGYTKYKHHGHGLCEKCHREKYKIENRKRISSSENISNDINNTISILENWKKKTGKRKPKMILINASGGGLRSATFTTASL